MISSPTGSRSNSGCEHRHPLLATVMLLLLPKIDVAFPNRRRKGVTGKTDDMNKEERKTILWEERRIVLFDKNLFLPTVSIELPRAEADAAGAVVELDIDILTDTPEGLDLPTLDYDPVTTARPEEAVEDLSLTERSTLSSPVGGEQNDTLEALDEDASDEPLDETMPSMLPSDDGLGMVEEGDVVASSTQHMEDLPLVVDGPMESISGGALVLVEGEKGQKARELLQQVALGILENGRSVTYVTTSQSVQGLVMEMFGRDQRIATYLPDRRLLCVPVFPLIEGRGTRDGLLDKLMGSEQLQTSDVLIIDSLSDFLGDRFEEANCIRFLEFVQNLNGMGKAVFLVVNDGQKEILPLRLESELQLSLPSGEEGILQIKRYQQAHQGASEFLRFQVHPRAGLLTHPLIVEPQ